MEQVIAAIKDAKRCLISAHIFPDPDALSSSAGLALGLTQLGKDCVVFYEDKVPLKMRFLTEGVNVTHEIPTEKFDALIVLDTASAKRVGGRLNELKPLVKTVINIDHHISNELWGDINYIDAKAAAAAEIVALLLEALKVKIYADIANRLFAGLMDDTGSFRFTNTSPRALEVAARLVGAGAKPADLANELYFNVPPHVMRLRAAGLSSIEMHQSGRVALLVITDKLLRSVGATAEDTEGLIDEVRSLEGVEIAILMRELGDSWKFSLRSKHEKHDVSAVAANFGGGGHRMAAGCKVGGELNDAKQRVLEKVSEAIAECH